MTNVNAFNTQTIPGQGATTALSGTAKGVLAGGGMAFWDFLLNGNTSAAATATILTDKASTTPDATMTLPGEDAGILLEGLSAEESLSLMELAAFLKGQEGEQTVKIEDLRVERIQKRIDQINKLVDHLTNGMPADAKNDAMIDTLVSRLDQQLEKLEAKMMEMQSGKTLAEDSNMPLLIALGLTPAQMAKISQRIEDVEKKLGRELTVEDLVAGVANIIPLPSDDNSLLVPASASGDMAADLTNLPDDTEPTDALAAQLNGLIVGVGSNGSDLQGSGDMDGLEGAADKPVMRGIELIQKLMAGAAQAGSSAQKAGEIVKTGFSSLLNLAGVAGDISVPSSWYQQLSSGIDFSSFDIQGGLPLTSAAQAAHVTTAVQQAGHAHPATQLVSAQLAKAAKDGGPQNMTIQLDPPELGRVDIRLEFGADKTIKAHLVVEKIETFHMLQRDAAFLDRALQSAGLDTNNGSSLSFEHAQDSGAFDRQKGGGNGQNGGGQKTDIDDTEIIQSTMHWQVDPDTGHVRYNILA